MPSVWDMLKKASGKRERDTDGTSGNDRSRARAGIVGTMGMEDEGGVGPELSVPPPQPEPPKDKEPGPSQASSSEGQEDLFHPDDIGHYVGKGRLNAAAKGIVLGGLWFPPKGYGFPHKISGKHRRSFQPAWLEKHKWLRYLAKLEGGLCGPCVAFSEEAFGGGKGGHQKSSVFVSKPFQDYKDASERFKQHMESPMHKDCLSRAASFATEHEQGSNVVTKISKKNHAAEVAQRKYLERLAELVVLLGHQGLAFRGDTMDGQYNAVVPGSKDTLIRKSNPGNYVAFLEHLMKHDEALRSYAAKLPQNATHQGPAAQNLFIALAGGQLVQGLVKEVKEKAGGLFSVLADETTDVSGLEQMSTVLRYIVVEDGKHLIKEAFLGFNTVTDLTGKGIAKSIMAVLVEAGLEKSGMVGCGFDGAPSMAGHMRGAQSRLRDDYELPWLVYTHCSSHVLNLVLVESVSVLAPEAKTIQGLINWVRQSGLRTSKLKEIIKTSQSGTRRDTLIQACETRWVQRSQAFQRFVELLPFVVELLEWVIDESSHADTRSKAQGYLSHFNRFESLFFAQLLAFVSGKFEPVSVALQKVDLDLIRCIDQIVQLRNEFDNKARDMEAFKRRLYDSVSQLGSDLGVPESGPFRRRGTPITDVRKYYYDNYWIKIMDAIVEEIDIKYDKHTTRAAQMSLLLPKQIVDSSQNGGSLDLVALVGVAEDFLPVLGCSKATLESELDSWVYHWTTGPGSQSPNPPANLLSALDACPADFYPAVHRAIRVMASLPCSTCTCERSFSCLRKLKTWLRASMSAERLSGLAHLSVNRNFPVDAKQMVKDYLAYGPRRPAPFASRNDFSDEDD